VLDEPHRRGGSAVHLDAIKNRLRRHELAYRLAKNAYRLLLGGGASRNHRTVVDVLDLDDQLAKLEEAHRDDHVKLREELAHIVFELPDARGLSRLDPFSAAYASGVRDLYARLATKPYDVSNEGFAGDDVIQRARWQTPYGQPATVVGQFLIAYGFLLKIADVPLGAHVLEVGCGEGSLSYVLAKMGYDLTCVDASEQFVRITEAATFGLETERTHVRVVHGDVAALSIERPIDAVIFFESFHHIFDHAKVLETLRRKITPGGVMVFAGEPIVDAECDVLPYPWGPRLDGESLRAIRRFGWMELGFTEKYFFELLRRSGLRAERFHAKDSYLADVVLARPR